MGCQFLLNDDVTVELAPLNDCLEFLDGCFPAFCREYFGRGLQNLNESEIAFPLKESFVEVASFTSLS